MDSKAINDNKDGQPDAAKSNVGFISMHDFLDFLKITCQVNESISNNKCCGDNSEKAVDYNQLAKNELVNSLLVKSATISPKVTTMHSDSLTGRNEAASSSSSSLDKKDKMSQHKKRSQSRKSKDGDKGSSLDPALIEKLEEVINEGILDSVLPFICSASLPTTSSSISHHNCAANNKLSTKPPPPTAVAPTTSSTIPTASGNSMVKLNLDHLGKRSDHLMPMLSKDRTGSRRKSMQLSPNSLAESEVVIHVCDEVKGVSRDFCCPQKLLVSKMGYFADVTAGQRLEDMDISVHCDLQIFEWLMRWVKRETISQEMWPLLDPTNVVPILVSASFLQMEPLLLDCLSFCHAHLNDVVKASANLSCLNDNIISRLAAMFTNLELEMVKDKKERVTPRLWTKLLQSLCEPEPQALRGHYASLADLFRCNRCSKYLTQSVASYIYCLPQNMRLNRWGQAISAHARDHTWQMTSYVANLYKDLRSWRRVYWRLWGNCHFLYCATCEMHFPTYQMNWCLYHPDQPQFLGPVTEGRMAGPAGRYPCCGQQAFRYETLPGPTGCQYREHTVQIDTDRDRAILKLAQIADEGGCLYEPPPPARLSSGLSSGGVNNEPWWAGMVLTPPRDRQGLLPCLNMESDIRTRMGGGAIGKKLPARQFTVPESSSETDTSETNKKYPILKQFSTSSDGCESDSSSPRPVKSRHRLPPRRKIKITGRHWSGDISARSNQDNQREFEEKAMKQVIAMVEKKTGTSDMLNSGHYNNYHQHGGTYVRLEAEWRENVKHKAMKVKGNK